MTNKKTERIILPITYSIGLWIMGFCLLLVSEYIKDMPTTVIVYMFLASPWMMIFARQQGGIDTNDEQNEIAKEHIQR